MWENQHFGRYKLTWRGGENGGGCLDTECISDFSCSVSSLNSKLLLWQVELYIFTIFLYLISFYILKLCIFSLQRGSTVTSTKRKVKLVTTQTAYFITNSKIRLLPRKKNCLRIWFLWWKKPVFQRKLVSFEHQRIFYNLGTSLLEATGHVKPLAHCDDDAEELRLYQILKIRLGMLRRSCISLEKLCHTCFLHKHNKKAT